MLKELRRLLLFAVAVLVLFFVSRVYAPAIDAAFVWDDHQLVGSSAAYQNATFGQVMTRSFWPDSPLSEVRVPYFRPFVLLSFLGDQALGGTPVEFHITNVLLHLAACAFLGITAVRAGASYPSALVAMLGWGVFPRLTEAVVWVAGRTDVLAAFFGLAALAVWPEIEPAPRRALWVRSLLGGVFLFGSCASKEVGIAFAITMGVALALRGGTRATLIRGAVSVGLPIIVYFALRAAAITDAPEARALGFGRRVGTVFEAIGRYAEMLIDPIHSRTSIGMLGEVDGVRAAAGVVVFGLACALTLRLVKRGSFGARIGGVLALASIVPVLHIIPFTLAGSVTADRLLYVPLAGVAIALAGALAKAPRWAGGVAIAAACFLGFFTHARARDYGEETRFWTIAAEQAHPHNTMPRMALASWLLPVEAEPACKLYERSAAVLAGTDLAGRSAHLRARESLTNCWVRMGLYDESLALLQELAKAYPSSSRIKLELALAHLHRRDFAAAGAELARLHAVSPALVDRFGIPPDRLSKLHHDDAVFDSLDRVHQSEHLAALGRAPDAAAAYLALAMDVTEPPSDRGDAVQYLFADGPIPDAERALAVVPPPRFGWDTKLLNRFHARRSVHEAFLDLRPRILALMQ